MTSVMQSGASAYEYPYSGQPVQTPSLPFTPPYDADGDTNGFDLGPTNYFAPLMASAGDALIGVVSMQVAAATPMPEATPIPPATPPRQSDWSRAPDSLSTPSPLVGHLARSFTNLPWLKQCDLPTRPASRFCACGNVSCASFVSREALDAIDILAHLLACKTIASECDAKEKDIITTNVLEKLNAIMTNPAHVWSFADGASPCLSRARLERKATLFPPIPRRQGVCSVA